MKKIFIILAMVLSSNTAYAAASEKDVATIDGIIAALYDVISGSKEDKRDWQRFVDLFDENAQLIFLSDGNPSGFVSKTAEEYVEIAEASFVKAGFYEQEISRKTERFGRIAHVFSTYEGRRTLDSEPFLRGINSIQLAYNGKRWFIETVFWQAENDNLPLPKKYLD